MWKPYLPISSTSSKSMKSDESKIAFHKRTQRFLRNFVDVKTSSVDLALNKMLTFLILGFLLCNLAWIIYQF